MFWIKLFFWAICILFVLGLGLLCGLMTHAIWTGDLDDEREALQRQEKRAGRP